LFDRIRRPEASIDRFRSTGCLHIRHYLNSFISLINHGVSLPIYVWRNHRTVSELFPVDTVSLHIN